MCKILLVDDEENVRVSLRGVLEHAGYDVLEAEDGVQALRSFRAESPDLVLTDIVMPEMDGLEAIMTMWREDPDVRVIAMSGGQRACGCRDVSAERANSRGLAHASQTRAWQQAAGDGERTARQSLARRSLHILNHRSGGGRAGIVSSFLRRYGSALSIEGHYGP